MSGSDTDTDDALQEFRRTKKREEKEIICLEEEEETQTIYVKFPPKESLSQFDKKRPLMEEGWIQKKTKKQRTLHEMFKNIEYKPKSEQEFTNHSPGPANNVPTPPKPTFVRQSSAENRLLMIDLRSTDGNYVDQWNDDYVRYAVIL